MHSPVLMWTMICNCFWVYQQVLLLFLFGTTDWSDPLELASQILCPRATVLLLWPLQLPFWRVTAYPGGVNWKITLTLALRTCILTFAVFHFLSSSLILLLSQNDKVLICFRLHANLSGSGLWFALVINQTAAIDKSKLINLKQVFLWRQNYFYWRIQL